MKLDRFLVKKKVKLPALRKLDGTTQPRGGPEVLGVLGVIHYVAAPISPVPAICLANCLNGVGTKQNQVCRVRHLLLLVTDDAF